MTTDKFVPPTQPISPAGPPPEKPPPTEPPEFYEGYQRQLKQFGLLTGKAGERLEAGERRLGELQSRMGARMFWDIPSQGTISFPIFPFVQFQIMSEEEFERLRSIAQAEIDNATRELSRFSWRQNLLASLPYFLVDRESDVRSVEDVLRAFPNEFLLPGDRNWLESTFNKLSYMIPPELPPDFQGDVSQVRQNVLDAILEEPRTETKAIHNLTVDELIRSFQPLQVELPPGLSAADVRDIMSTLEFDEETQAEINDLHNLTEELKNDWAEQSAYITLIRDGLLNAEAPDLTPLEFTKMLFTQPALATLEMLEKYFNILPRPLTSWAIINFPSISEDTDAADLERLYEQYRAEGVEAWEAYSKAYVDWNVNWGYKMIAETLFDPTTYIGLGIATKITKPFPYLGRFVGAVERGWNQFWDIPFAGIRKLIKAIPQTPTQAALSYARQAFMDSRAFLRRYTGKELHGLTVPEIREAFEFAIEQTSQRPFETGDLAVRVGRYLTDYDFLDDTLVREWTRVVGGEGAQVTQQVIHDVNFQFDLFYRKSYTAAEAAPNILLSLGVEVSERNMAKIANMLKKHGTRITDTAMDKVTGDTAHDVLEGILKSIEDMQVRKALSPEYIFALKMGRATSMFNRTVGRTVDAITRNSILTKIDRMFTAPLANQYLLFTNYGPFNVMESGIRSFLGGGELLYPRAASPVDELVRVGEGLTNMPYEFVMAQRQLGRLEIAVIDPKTHKTIVFSKGKIPGVTRDAPVGFKISIGGKDYPMRSWQNWNDMFGDIGTKQRANYFLTKYKQFLTELGGDQIDAIAKVFDDNRAILDGIESISKSEKQDLIRVLEQDATVGPDMIRKHDIPLPELERRRALRDINKLLDKCNDIYSPHKHAIREQTLDGSIWRDVDASIEGIKDSVREFNIVSMAHEAKALDNLVKDFKGFAPANSEELLRNVGFISDIVDGISERISEVRQLTRSRAARLTGKEADDFYLGSSEVLGDFLGKSGDDIGQMLDGIKTNIRRPRTLLDDLTRDIRLGEFTPVGIEEVGAGTLPIRLEGEDVGSILLRQSKDKPNELVVDTLTMIKPDTLNRSMLKDIDILVHDYAAKVNADVVLIQPKPEHQQFYAVGGYTKKGMLFEKRVMQPKPQIQLTETQLTQLDSLAESVRVRHANALSARELDRQILNDAIARTPRRKRNKEFWEWLENKRSTEAWEPYWAREETLFEAVEDAKLGMMREFGIDITVPPVPEVLDRLAPAHVAYLMGVTGDDMYKALTKVGAMTTIRSKNRFTTWVYSRSKKAAARVGKTPEDIGFSREAIGDVYDQMWRNVGLDPNFVAKEPLTPAMLQLEDVRQELIRLKGIKGMPEADYVKFKQYLNSTADDLEKLPMHTDEGQARWLDTKEEAMMKTRTQYELDFTDYDNRNMVDAAMRMIYPFWTYEWQRWFWLPRAMVRTPGVGTGVGRYMEYSDDGYIPVPGTDIQFNPLRGTVFMGGFRRLMLRDYPEYYDAFPGMEIIDYLSRVGFYPGAHIMLPIIITGAAKGKPEWGEVLPGWVKTGMNAARAASPEGVGAFLDHIFPDRFRDYLTMLTLGGQGLDADAIWRKKISGEPLTEEENKLWLRAEAKATGLKGILFEQTGLFRLRPQEYTDIREASLKIIEDMTGVPARTQEIIRRRYAVTGKRFSDYYPLDALQQKILYEIEAYRRWQGVTTPLYPSTWQEEDVRVRDYYEAIETLYEDYRSIGIFDEQGNKLADSVNELTRQWIAGEIGPDQWLSGRGDLLSQASAAAREIGIRDYPDVPKTLDERAARFEERGLPAPTYSPDQELMYMYFDIRPELTFNWESGRNEYDYDTYYAKIDAILETLQPEQRERFLERIQYNWNSMERLYWTISREYLRPYRMIKHAVLEGYSEEEVMQIRRYEVARGEEREALKEVIGPDGLKLISGFQQKVREARLRLRKIDPELDAWAYFFGTVDKMLTTQAQELYNEFVKKYMRPEFAG